MVKLWKQIIFTADQFAWHPALNETCDLTTSSSEHFLKLPTWITWQSSKGCQVLLKHCYSISTCKMSKFTIQYCLSVAAEYVNKVVWK